MKWILITSFSLYDIVEKKLKVPYYSTDKIHRQCELIVVNNNYLAAMMDMKYIKNIISIKLNKAKNIQFWID